MRMLAPWQLVLLVLARATGLARTPPPSVALPSPVTAVAGAQPPSCLQPSRSAAASRSPWPLQQLLSSLAPSAGATVPSCVTIRGALPADLPALANLCTDSFFGTHAFGDGPVIFTQRAAIYAKVFAQLSRRIRIQEGRECRLLVAVDSKTGVLRGCIDLAVHLFDRREQRFELTCDEMPAEPQGRYAWLPYVASLAVSPASRRQGIARVLMREAERTAREWGYRELCLEVACVNLEAMGFYRKLGYRILRSDVPGTGATITETVDGIYWRVLPVEKYVMKRRLAAF